MNRRLIDVDTLIEKLNENIPFNWSETDYELGKQNGYTDAMNLVKEQKIIEPNDMVENGFIPIGVHKQVQWEREVAIDQLKSYGVEFGEKAEMKKVVHGKWIYQGVWAELSSFQCSQCGKHVVFDRFTQKCIYDYCPKCGAIMDGQ